MPASGKFEMRQGKIAISLDAAAQPCDGFRVGAKRQLCNADNCHPIGKSIAGREAKRFKKHALAGAGSTLLEPPDVRSASALDDEDGARRLSERGENEWAC